MAAPKISPHTIPMSKPWLSMAVHATNSANPELTTPMAISAERIEIQGSLDDEIALPWDFLWLLFCFFLAKIRSLSI
jgi:hypothetical protein